MRRALAILLLVLAATPTGARADTQILVQETVRSAGWVAARITVPEDAAIDLSFDGRSTDDRFMASVWILDSDGTVVAFEPTGAFQWLTASASVRSSVADLTVRTKRPEFFGDWGYGVTLNDVSAGTYTTILATAGTIAGTAMKISATSGSTVEGVTDGTHAFLATEEDFSGTVFVASAPGGPRAVVARSAILFERIEHELFGLFSGGYALSAGNIAISYVGPDGNGEGADVYPFEHGSAGTYTFRIDEQIGAGLFGPQVLLLGADVILP
jgi:hypothetical protein